MAHLLMELEPSFWSGRAPVVNCATPRGKDAGQPTLKSYAGDMRFVAQAILPTYIEALESALDRVVARLPAGRGRRLLLGHRNRLRNAASDLPFPSLHRLVMIGEAQGWLSADESIIIRKLAYRCAFYIRRAEEDG